MKLCITVSLFFLLYGTNVFHSLEYDVVRCFEYGRCGNGMYVNK